MILFLILNILLKQRGPDETVNIQNLKLKQIIYSNTRCSQEKAGSRY